MRIHLVRLLALVPLLWLSNGCATPANTAAHQSAPVQSTSAKMSEILATSPVPTLPDAAPTPLR
jgi:hypothetical protein